MRFPSPDMPAFSDRFEFRILYEITSEHEDYMRQYNDLLQQEYAKDGLIIGQKEAADGGPDDIVILVIDTLRDRVAGGGRLRVKRAGSRKRLPFESAKCRRIETLMPDIDRKLICYAQAGCVVVDPEVARDHADAQLGAHIQSHLRAQAVASQVEFCVSTVAARNYLGVRHTLQAGSGKKQLQKETDTGTQIRVLAVTSLLGMNNQQVPVIHMCYTISPLRQMRELFHRACAGEAQSRLEKAAYQSYKLAREADKRRNLQRQAATLRQFPAQTVSDKVIYVSPVSRTTASRRRRFMRMWQRFSPVPWAQRQLFSSAGHRAPAAG